MLKIKNPKQPKRYLVKNSKISAQTPNKFYQKANRITVMHIVTRIFSQMSNINH